MRSFSFAALVLVCLVSVAARADEGMWTFNNLPTQQLKQRYGFDATPNWVEHVQLSAVRFNSGGSGSFVSSHGLVMTNHHVGADCISKLAIPGRDYIKDGYFAKDAAAELRCPDLELNVLLAISDVTAEVKSVEKAGMAEAAVNQAQKEKMSAIEKRCADETHDRCDVVMLYAGGVYNLYRYKKYTDVRLVFAPEFEIAFFGGDPDNFEFPRYDLDVAFFRAYENNQAVAPSHYLRFSDHGPVDKELAFVAGHPGATERLDTVAQLELLRDLIYPTYLKEADRVLQAIKKYEQQGDEAKRQSQHVQFYVANSKKAITGYRKGLVDAELMGKRTFAEAQLKQRVLTSTENRRRYGAIWSEIAASQKQFSGFFNRWLYLEGRRGSLFNSELFGIARQLVRAAAERQLPSEKRLREFRDSNLASLELGLLSSAPIYDGLEEALLASALLRLERELGPADETVRLVLAGQSPEARAKALVTGSKLKDPALRKQLYNDPKALAASKDPMIVLARAIDPEARQLRRRYEDEVESVVKRNMAELSRAQFALDGTTRYPDATFTLRLSFGQVLGYTSSGKQIASMTHFGGLYDRSAQAHNQFPWALPARWVAAKSRLNLKTPYNMVTTNDIIGGNSGSPVINAKAEVVGLIFDGNIESLPGVFAYDPRCNRAVSVTSSALVEALRQVYDAPSLADELQPQVHHSLRDPHGLASRARTR